MSSRKPALASSLGRAVAAAAMAAAAAGCQSATQSSGAGGQPAGPFLSSDRDAFIGLGDDELAGALGQPKQVRRDAPAEVWQYSGADCVVDFYLYDSGGRLEVAFVEARDLRAADAASERCVKSLLQSVSAAPSGTL